MAVRKEGESWLGPVGEVLYAGLVRDNITLPFFFPLTMLHAGWQSGRKLPGERRRDNLEIMYQRDLQGWDPNYRAGIWSVGENASSILHNRNARGEGLSVLDAIYKSAPVYRQIYDTPNLDKKIGQLEDGDNDLNRWRLKATREAVKGKRRVGNAMYFAAYGLPYYSSVALGAAAIAAAYPLGYLDRNLRLVGEKTKNFVSGRRYEKIIENNKIKNVAEVKMMGRKALAYDTPNVSPWSYSDTGFFRNKNDGNQREVITMLSGAAGSGNDEIAKNAIGYLTQLAAYRSLDEGKTGALALGALKGLAGSGNRRAVFALKSIADGSFYSSYAVDEKAVKISDNYKSLHLQDTRNKMVEFRNKTKNILFQKRSKNIAAAKEAVDNLPAAQQQQQQQQQEAAAQAQQQAQQAAVKQQQGDGGSGGNPAASNTSNTNPSPPITHLKNDPSTEEANSEASAKRLKDATSYLGVQQDPAQVTFDGKTVGGHINATEGGPTKFAAKFKEFDNILYGGSSNKHSEIVSFLTRNGMPQDVASDLATKVINLKNQADIEKSQNNSDSRLQGIDTTSRCAKMSALMVAGSIISMPWGLAIAAAAGGLYYGPGVFRNIDKILSNRDKKQIDNEKTKSEISEAYFKATKEPDQQQQQREQPQQQREQPQPQPQPQPGSEESQSEPASQQKVGGAPITQEKTNMQLAKDRLTKSLLKAAQEKSGGELTKVTAKAEQMAKKAAVFGGLDAQDAFKKDFVKRVEEKLCKDDKKTLKAGMLNKLEKPAEMAKIEAEVLAEMAKSEDVNVRIGALEVIRGQNIALQVAADTEAEGVRKVLGIPADISEDFLVDDDDIKAPEFSKDQLDYLAQVQYGENFDNIKDNIKDKGLENGLQFVKDGGYLEVGASIDEIEAAKQDKKPKSLREQADNKGVTPSGKLPQIKDQKEFNDKLVDRKMVDEDSNLEDVNQEAVELQKHPMLMQVLYNNQQKLHGDSAVIQKVRVGGKDQYVFGKNKYNPVTIENGGKVHEFLTNHNVKTVIDAYTAEVHERVRENPDVTPDSIALDKIQGVVGKVESVNDDNVIAKARDIIQNKSKSGLDKKQSEALIKKLDLQERKKGKKKDKKTEDDTSPAPQDIAWAIVRADALGDFEAAGEKKKTPREKVNLLAKVVKGAAGTPGNAWANEVDNSARGVLAPKPTAPKENKNKRTTPEEISDIQVLMQKAVRHRDVNNRSLTISAYPFVEGDVMAQFELVNFAFNTGKGEDEKNARTNARNAIVSKLEELHKSGQLDKPENKWLLDAAKEIAKSEVSEFMKSNPNGDLEQAFKQGNTCAKFFKVQKDQKETNDKGANGKRLMSPRPVSLSAVAAYNEVKKETIDKRNTEIEKQKEALENAAKVAVGPDASGSKEQTPDQQAASMKKTSEAMDLFEKDLTGAVVAGVKELDSEKIVKIGVQNDLANIHKMHGKESGIKYNKDAVEGSKYTIEDVDQAKVKAAYANYKAQQYALERIASGDTKIKDEKGNEVKISDAIGRNSDKSYYLKDAAFENDGKTLNPYLEAVVKKEMAQVLKEKNKIPGVEIIQSPQLADKVNAAVDNKDIEEVSRSETSKTNKLDAALRELGISDSVDKTEALERLAGRIVAKYSGLGSAKEQLTADDHKLLKEYANAEGCKEVLEAWKKSEKEEKAMRDEIGLTQALADSPILTALGKISDKQAFQKILSRASLELIQEAKDVDGSGNREIDFGDLNNPKGNLNKTLYKAFVAEINVGKDAGSEVEVSTGLKDIQEMKRDIEAKIKGNTSWGQYLVGFVSTAVGSVTRAVGMSDSVTNTAAREPQDLLLQTINKNKEVHNTTKGEKYSVSYRADNDKRTTPLPSGGRGPGGG